MGPKGRGTNMRALVAASASGTIPAELDVIVSPIEGTAAAEFAKDNGLPLAIVPPDEEYARRLLETLKDCTILCLAGYTRLLPPEVLDRFPSSILNIHPALLPKFGGKGMYGIRVHQAVIAQGETESGCTVHYVTPVYDEGEIVLQNRCPVYQTDTPEELAARVLQLETETYPEAVRKVIVGRST